MSLKTHVYSITSSLLMQQQTRSNVNTVWLVMVLLTKNHGWVDLTVGVSGTVAAFSLLQIIRNHGYHDCLLLKGINVLHHTPSYKVLPAARETLYRCNGLQMQIIHFLSSFHPILTPPLSHLSISPSSFLSPCIVVLPVFQHLYVMFL